MERFLCHGAEVSGRQAEVKKINYRKLGDDMEE
jgi:hypothetical protein